LVLKAIANSSTESVKGEEKKEESKSTLSEKVQAKAKGIISSYEELNKLGFFENTKIFYEKPAKPYSQQENDMISFLSDRKMTSFIEPLGLNKFNSVTVNIHVNQGDIILFPSDLSHSVPVNNEDYTRVSLAFNSYFEGILGDSDDDPNYIEIKLAQ
jgi:hypothetical protein